MTNNYTPARKKATAKYKAALDRFEITAAKGTKELLKQHTALTGESMNAFLVRAIHETIERDRQKINNIQH